MLSSEVTWERASRQLSPEERLIFAILRQAVRDACGVSSVIPEDGWDKEGARVCARNWIIHSLDCDRYCEMVGVDPDDVLDSIRPL